MQGFPVSPGTSVSSAEERAALFCYVLIDNENHYQIE